MSNIINKWNQVLSFITIIISIYVLSVPIRNYNYYLMAVYVIVNCLRAIYPKRDVESTCLHKSHLSSIMFGRTIATIAEICFILLLINYYKSISDNNISSKTNLVLIIIIISEVFSWLGCLTKNQIYNSLEESGWLVSFLIFSKITWDILRVRNDDFNLKFQLFCYTCFIIFLFFIDIPMYYNRYKNHKKGYLSINQGLKSIMSCKIVTNNYDTWKDEILWQSGYFVFGSLYSVYIYNLIK